MAFGHNSNVTIAGDTYHVQTEERGAAQALIDTTVYLQGRVLHRRTNSFLDLLPLNPDREQALRLRVDTQHRGVVDEIRSGKLRLTVPGDVKTSAPRAVVQAESAPAPLHLELLNAKTWLTGKRALLQIVIHDDANKPVEHAMVTDLLREMGLDPGRVAIERNLEILSRPDWQKTSLQAGDRYEIVQFVGGG